MKKILIFASLLFSLNSNAQIKSSHSGNGNSSGLILAIAGLLTFTIGLVVPDGSEYTYMNPTRDFMMVAGLSLTIGGLRYNHINNKR